ncbi:MAG: helix-hairpin-helix domain-containing protein [Spirochaetes bacterium]|nr:helix-hairpin-helix domain-containing protein [Spirochaetota bacterium]
MLNRILGTLSGRTPDSIYVLTGGVEWDISVPVRTVGLFGPVGGQIEVFVWLQHWEDGMKLFGFPSERDRTLFLDLIKVEGIGPKQSLKILSGISSQDLALALDTGNLAALQRISGVGPKLAQKMVLALKGKLVDIDSAADQGAVASPWGDLAAALVDMGFDRKSVEAVVSARAADVGTGPESEKELFRIALLELSAGGGRR